MGGFWQSRDAQHEHDRLFAQADHSDTLQRQRTMRKAASMATLTWPRPASSPQPNGISPAAIGQQATPVQDRSPFPPRISSLNRVPLPGWDAELPSSPSACLPSTASSRRRPATSHATAESSWLASGRARTATAEMGPSPPGTAHAASASTLGIGRARERSGTSDATPAAQGTPALPLPRQRRSQTHSHLLDTSQTYSSSSPRASTLYPSDESEYIQQFAITRRSSSLFALEAATAGLQHSSPAGSETGASKGSRRNTNANALMPAASAFDLRNGNTNSTSSSSPLLSQLHTTQNQSPELSHLPIYASQHSKSSVSPTMRKASPMPQAFPQPAYPTPSTPWQNGTNILTSPTDNTPPAGKTSQVLAKLTSENDRLRREIKAEKAAKEEALQSFQALKSRVGWLEEKKSMLSMQLDTNENALARKERRLDDMKVQVEEEKGRRKRAEEREAEMGRKLGETVSKASEEIAVANTARKHAENAYATLENEYSGLTRRIAFLRKEVDSLTGKINENSAVHKKQVLQLEVLVEQLRGSQERSERQVSEMGKLLQSYWDTEENTKRLETEMQEAVHEMRWVMRLHESREGNGSARPLAAPVASQQPTHSKKSSTSSPAAPKSPKQRRKVVPPGYGVAI